MLERNLNFFQAKFPQLYETLRQTTPAELERTRKGTAFTIRINNSYIHSPYDPHAESQRRVTAIKPTLRGAVIFIGLGLGYDLAAFDEIHDTDIIIIENRIDLLRASFAIVDYERFAASNRFHFVVTPDKDLIAKLPINPGVLLVDNKPLVNADESGFYRTIMGLIVERLKRTVADLTTTGYFSKIWLRNTVENVLWTEHAISLPHLHGKFSSYPAAVISSGPTLDHTIGQIAPNADRCVIICTSSAAARAADAGIEPHFIISTDGGYYNSWHLRGLHFPNAVLVTDLSVHRSVHKQHKGARAFFSSGLSFIDHFMTDREKVMPSIPMQGTVAAGAVMLASYLGCREIFLFGQDVGYPYNLTHCRGTIAARYRSGMLDRMKTFDSMDMHDLAASRVELDRDYEGKRILSDFKLKLYKEWFASVRLKLFQTSPKAVFIPSISIGKIKDSFPASGSVRSDLNSLPAPAKPVFDKKIVLMEVEKYVDQLDGITDIDGFLAGVDDSLSRGIHDYASFDFYRRERGLTGTSEIANKVREYFKICRTAWEKK